MQNSEYQRNYIKQRYATDPDFRAQRHEAGNRYQRERYANDPEFRNRCQRSIRNCQLKKQHGITLEQLEAQIAAQQGNCACCDKALGRIKRIRRTESGEIGLVCTSCANLVKCLRQVCKRAETFAAHFEGRGMAAELRRFYGIMAACGWTPAQGESAGQST